VCPGLSRVQTAKHLLAVPIPVVLYRDDFVRRLCHVRTVTAIRVPCLPRAFPWLRAVDGRRDCLFHAQLLMAIRLTRALLLLSMARDRLCREGQAYLPDPAPHPLDLCHQPVPG
jgi:hypothetical protein